MQAEKSDNGHKYQDEGNLADNSSLVGMNIGEKETNGESNLLANVVEKTNNLTLMAQKSNESDNQTVLSGLTIDAPRINKNQESDQGAMDSNSNKPDFHQGGANLQLVAVALCPLTEAHPFLLTGGKGKVGIQQTKMSWMKHIMVIDFDQKIMTT
eukprot:4506449-Ditylum_brightwellii.AAC.1